LVKFGCVHGFVEFLPDEVPMDVGIIVGGEGGKVGGLVGTEENLSGSELAEGNGDKAEGRGVHRAIGKDRKRWGLRREGIGYDGVDWRKEREGCELGLSLESRGVFLGGIEKVRGERCAMKRNEDKRADPKSITSGGVVFAALTPWGRSHINRFGDPLRCE
jgi:hypothetical protein